MHTGTSILIQAAKEKIFETAANLELWPAILPHYRYVTVHSDDGRVKQATMAATRQFRAFRFPVKWETSQVVLPEEGRI